MESEKKTNITMTTYSLYEANKAKKRVTGRLYVTVCYVHTTEDQLKEMIKEQIEDFEGRAEGIPDDLHLVVRHVCKRYRVDHMQQSRHMK